MELGVLENRRRALNRPRGRKHTELFFFQLSARSQNRFDWDDNVQVGILVFFFSTCVRKDKSVHWEMELVTFELKTYLQSNLTRIPWIDYYQRKLHSDRKSRMHSSLSWPRVFFSIYWEKVWGGRFLLEHKRLQSHPCCCIGSGTMSPSRVQCLRK